MTALFEDNQRDLEGAVENLSYLLESNIADQPIAKIRADITNQSVCSAKLWSTDSRHMYRSDTTFSLTTPCMVILR